MLSNTAQDAAEWCLTHK